MFNVFSKFHPFIKNNRGQALVEIALVLPLLLLIIFGIIEFGRIFSAQLTLTHASREGARAGALGNSNTEIVEIVSSSSYPLEIGAGSVEITPDENSRFTGDSLTVEINSSVSIYTPFLNGLLENPFPVSAKTTMRME